VPGTAHRANGLLRPPDCAKGRDVPEVQAAHRGHLERAVTQRGAPSTSRRRLGAAPNPSPQLRLTTVLPCAKNTHSATEPRPRAVSRQVRPAASGRAFARWDGLRRAQSSRAPPCGGAVAHAHLGSFLAAVPALAALLGTDLPATSWLSHVSSSPYSGALSAACAHIVLQAETKVTSGSGRGFIGVLVGRRKLVVPSPPGRVGNLAHGCTDRRTANSPGRRRVDGKHTGQAPCGREHPGEAPCTRPRLQPWCREPPTPVPSPRGEGPGLAEGVDTAGGGAGEGGAENHR